MAGSKQNPELGRVGGPLERGQEGQAAAETNFPGHTDLCAGYMCRTHTHVTGTFQVPLWDSKAHAETQRHSQAWRGASWSPQGYTASFLGRGQNEGAPRSSALSMWGDRSPWPLLGPGEVMQMGAAALGAQWADAPDVVDPLLPAPGP